MFLIHPSDLPRRRGRCRPVVKSLLGAEREIVSTCNICGSRQSVILARRDRYGFPVRTALCRNCGLIYLVDRFTSANYADFYRSGVYRSLTSLYNGSRSTAEQLEEVSATYANQLIAAMEGYVQRSNGARLLDVGGGTGAVAQGIAEHFGLAASVLDPAAADVAAARRLGLEAFEGSLEDWDSEAKFDLVLLCKTIEHLFDLKRALLKIRELLKPDGLFYCDIVDFTEACRHEGPPEVTAKIDHCYWLCQETAPAIFRSTGFEVVSINTISGPNYVGFLLRPCEPIGPPAAPGPWIDGHVRRLREMEAEWYDSASRPYGAVDWLRRKAYRVKRTILLLAGK